jgi:Lon protease-like protein
MQDLETFPLFPLGLVALPGEIVPLHVFEPRYRIMFAELLDAGNAFGIVWADGERLADVGCACVVEQVLQRYDDGRLDVACRGTSPVAVAGAVVAVPYPAAPVVLLSDDDEPADADAAREARAAYAALVTLVGASDPGAERLAAMTAYDMAATVELGLADKQALLELRSEPARLRLLTGLLVAARDRLSGTALAQAQARSNGRVRF